MISTLQFSTLSGCVKSAGAKCQLINSPNSVPLATFKAKESVVLSCKRSAPSPAEGEWLNSVEQYLEKYVHA